MKIHRVAMTGFGPYRDTETVDFDAFDDDGIFLITGRTGAGKSSILDAITYGLFGSIPRYDGAAGDKVRSDYIGPTDRCEVVVELTTNDVRYRVTRSPSYERPKRRGEGTTTEAATFELAILHGDTWEVNETRLGNADTRIEEIVRLNAKQFLQVILLAQGQFQEFLVASSDKRRDLLRMLFDTRRFSDYGDTLFSRTRELGGRLATSSTAVSTNTTSLVRETSVAVPDSVDLDDGTGVREWVAGLVESQQAVLAAASTERTRTQAVCDDAKQLLDVARSTAERQSRRARSLVRQAELAHDRDAFDASRARLATSRRAAIAWHAVDASRSATTRLAEVTRTHQSADEAYRHLRPEAPTDAESLTTGIQQLTELQGSLRTDLATEQGLGVLEDAVAGATQQLADFDEQVQADTAARAAVSTRISALATSLRELEQQASALSDTQHAVTALAARHAAALRAASTAAEVERALVAQLTAGQDVTTASAQRDSFRARQRAGYAGTLAQSLRPDEPCAVCGSVTHPSPAALADDHVDDEAVDRVEADYDRAIVRSREADRAVDQLQARLVGERLAAGDETAEVVQAQVVAAEQALAEAQDAVAAVTAAVQERDDLSADLERLDHQIQGASARHTELVAAQASAGAVLARAVDSLTEARGEHGTVAARLADVQTATRTTQALLTATSALLDADQRAASAREALATALTEHEFDDAAAVDAALLPAPDQDALEASINAYDSETRAVATALSSDDLLDLPDDPVDVVAPQTAFDEAEAANVSAIGVESAARPKLGTVEGLAAEVFEALDSARELREQYAVVNRLAHTMRGQPPNTMKMMLETFALAAELEEIVVAANSRLTTMTGGRYEFLHSDAIARGNAQSGLALDVLDAYTGETRAPQSLSGGEKFQASLALALGLAEVLTSRAGGLRLDTLFIDEGFGSLDADTLETTMATLDNLRDGGRTIGLISHVEAMKESIPAQLYVDPTDGGWSTIRTP